MEQDRGAGFEKVFVDKGHDGNIVLWASGAGDNGMVIIDQFFQIAHAHGTASHIVDSTSFVRVSI